MANDNPKIIINIDRAENVHIGDTYPPPSPPPSPPSTDAESETEKRDTKYIINIRRQP